MTVLTGGAEHTDTLVSGVRGVRGSIFADTFTATDGNSEHFRGRGGDDTIDGGGAGDGDQADYLFAPGRVDVDLADDPDDAGPFTGQASNYGYGTTDLLANIENVRGSFNSDTVRGDGNANQLLGMDGDDLLDGRGGDDDLQGGDDDDTLIGGAGNDDLQGGNGIDEADYSGAAGVVTADLQDDPDVGGPFTGRATADGDGGVDRLSSIEWLRGGANGDTLAGNGTQNRLRGEGGDDRLIGRGGTDQLEGGAGADTFVFEAIADVTTIGSNRERGPDEMGDILFGFQSTDTLEFNGNAFLDGAGTFAAGRLRQRISRRSTRYTTAAILVWRAPNLYTRQ